LKIISGISSQLLASRVANYLNCKLALTEFKRFPDGELYTRIVDDIAEDVVLIQTIRNDTDFIHLLQLMDACNSNSYRNKIQVVIPYMGYARQDKSFKNGEAVSARAIAQVINADQVFTINIHNQNILNYFNTKATDLDASPLIGKYVNSLDLKDPIIIAPDMGAIDLCKNAASHLKIDYDYLEKTRLSGEKVVIKPKELDVTARDVVILDDIISTGGTIAETVSILKKQNVRDIYVACIHPVLAQNAILRLFKSGVKDIIATDTIETGVSVVSVAPLIAERVKKE